MSKTLKRLAASLLVLAAASLLSLALYCFDNKYTWPGDQPMAGLLFMDEGDLQETPLRFLWNGWLFYPDALLTPSEAETLDPSRLVSLRIGEHNTFAFSTETQNPHGCGTYLLTLMLPGTPHTYAIELPEIFSAYRFYVNDKLLAQLGEPESPGYEPLLQNRMVSFTASGPTKLMLAVRNESYFYSGLVYPPAFGEPQAVLQLHNLRLFACAILLTATLLAAVFSLWVFLKAYRRQPDAGLFSLLSLCIAVFISYTVVHSFVPMGILPWYPLEFAGIYLASLLIVLLHNKLCDVSAPVRWISVSITGAFCLMFVLYGFLASHVTQAAVQLFTVLIPAFKIMTALYLLTVSFLSLHLGKQRGRLLFYADIFYAGMLLWDRLLPAYEPVAGGWFYEWGSLALVLALGVLLWQDLTVGYRLSLTFREEKRQMERQLEMQQNHFRQLTRQVEESRQMRHDFRQHLLTIRGMAPENPSLQEYVNSLSSVQEAARPERYCGSLAVDALLYQYVSMAREKDVEITVQTQSPGKVVIPDEVAFCTILGNLLENALEACLRQKDGDRFIHLFMRWQEPNIHILQENSFDGIISPSQNGYLSRKHEGEGIGILSIRRLTAQMNGFVDFSQDEKVFLANLILPIEQNASP